MTSWGVENLQAEIVQDQHFGARQRPEKPGVAAIAASKRQVAEQFGQALVIPGNMLAQLFSFRLSLKPALGNELLDAVTRKLAAVDFPNHALQFIHIVWRRHLSCSHNLQRSGKNCRGFCLDAAAGRLRFLSSICRACAGRFSSTWSIRASAGIIYAFRFG